MAFDLAQYSVALFLALATLMKWSKHRHRFARRYRSAVSHALHPSWFEPPSPSGPVLCGTPEECAEEEQETEAVEVLD